MTEIYLGTSGWSYAEWEDILYLKKKGKLKQYSSIFPTVEINSTFYSIPNENVIKGWAIHTPPNFVFSAKLPQIITHKKAIDVSKGIEKDLNLFIKAMEPILQNEKLECLLVQLPPFLKFNADRLESFLALLPNFPKFAVEFRHESWLREETFDILERYRKSYVIVDEPLLPSEVHVTSNTAYFRFHGRGDKPWFNYKYSLEEINELIPKIKEAARESDRFLGYFNNHFHAYAPENCLQTMRMLGVTTEQGSEILEKISIRRNTLKFPKTLENWTGPIIGDGLHNLLTKLADDDIIKKSKSIPDTNFSLRKDDKSALAAYIEDTVVEINFKLHKITHYCPIWKESSSIKKLCPHIVKCMLSIDKIKAIGILSNINSSIEMWDFESKLAVEFPDK